MGQTLPVATLLPADFEVTSLEHSERRVCQAMLDGLDDTWVVVPAVPILVNNKDCEIDLVLVSPTMGVVLVETKGGSIELREGVWLQNARALHRTPMAQVSNAKYQLIKRMRSAHIDLHDLFITCAVALPDVDTVPAEGLGPDTPFEHVFAAPQLAFPEFAIDALLREHQPVPAEQFAAFVRALRPDIVLDGNEGKVLQWSATRLDEETRLHLRNLQGLDTNRRVLVTGGAGTGKTLLAIEWAKRAVGRGERTVMLCFNKPIAEQLERSLDGVDLMSGTYHDVALRLLEPHGFRIGANPTPEYWRDELTNALEFHAAAIGAPFDTIVIDEGQDFHPHWIASLERLLDPAGARRLLVVADPSQAIYVQPWSPPDDMMQMPLVHNLRNCLSIARVVQRLGGPTPLPSAPFGDAVEHLQAGGMKEVRKRVRDAVAHLTTKLGVPFSQIAVLTPRSRVRDELVAEPPEGVPLVRWEDRSEEGVLCETVQRTKGLERTAVILVDTSGDLDRTLLYVGISRAIASLRLVGPPALAEAAGVPTGARGSSST